MAQPTFRDRFYSRPVARALTSPLSILVAGAGMAAAVLVGLPLLPAAAVGAAAYGARVALAVPRERKRMEMNPFALSDPWRTFVWQARKAERQFDEAVAKVPAGPLRSLGEIAARVRTGVEECWEVATAGEALVQARSFIDVGAITTELSQLPGANLRAANPALVETAEALQAQLDTARRMDVVIASTHDRLRLLNARLGELVTRVLELSVRPQAGDELTSLGADVESIVGEMESLRQALDETDRAGRQQVAAAPHAAAPPPPAATLGPTEPAPPPEVQPAPPPPPTDEPPPTPSPGSA